MAPSCTVSSHSVTRNMPELVHPDLHRPHPSAHPPKPAPFTSFTASPRLPDSWFWVFLPKASSYFLRPVPLWPVPLGPVPHRRFCGGTGISGSRRLSSAARKGPCAQPYGQKGAELHFHIFASIFPPLKGDQQIAPTARLSL